MLSVRNGSRAVDFYKSAFDAIEVYRVEDPAGAVVSRPRAEECISYSLPAFRLDGVLVAFGASTDHCSFYPMSPAVMEAHEKDLQKYHTSKGTIRFQADKPLPAGLVKKLVKARIAENLARRRKSG